MFSSCSVCAKVVIIAVNSTGISIASTKLDEILSEVKLFFNTLLNVNNGYDVEAFLVKTRRRSHDVGLSAWFVAIVLQLSNTYV